MTAHNTQGLGLSKLAANTSTTFGRQVGSGLLQLVIIAIIARAYGPEGNGVYNVALLLPSMLATFLNLGVGPANVYFISAGKVAVSTAWQYSLKLSLYLSVLGVVTGSVLLWRYSEQWFPGVPQELLWFALSIFPISLLLGFVSSIFQGLQQFRAFNLILLAQPAFTLIIITALVITGISNLIWLLVAHLIGLVITLLASIYLLQPYLGQAENSNKVNKNYGSFVLNYGYKAHLSNILAFVNYKADIFLVNFLLTPLAAGIYVISVQLCERLWMFSQSISTVLLPRLSELSENEELRRELTPLIARLTLLSTSIASIILAIIGLPLIGLIFGSQYLEAYGPLLILLPGIALLSPARIVANDLAARGRPELNMYRSFVVVMCNVIGNILLIPDYGLAGAAFATTFAYIINLLLTLVMYCYITKVPILKILIVQSGDLKKIFSFVVHMMRRLAR